MVSGVDSPFRIVNKYDARTDEFDGGHGWAAMMADFDAKQAVRWQRKSFEIIMRPWGAVPGQSLPLRCDSGLI